VVKYATVTSAESETRTVIPRFMFVLGAPTSGDQIPSFESLRSLILKICHSDRKIKCCELTA
jgi:hypothetical protein